MAENKEKDFLTSVNAGSTPIYKFYDHDEFNVRLEYVDDPERYIIIDKQALLALSRVVKDLADKFTK